MAKTKLFSPEKVCRTCLMESPYLKSLLSNISSDKTLLDALCNIVNTEILIKNHLPDKICNDCESIICKTDDFRRRCIESESMLEQQSYNHVSMLIEKRERKSKTKIKKVRIEHTEVDILPFLCSRCYSTHPTLLSFIDHRKICNVKKTKRKFEIYENNVNTDIIKQEIEPTYSSNFHSDYPVEYDPVCDVTNFKNECSEQEDETYDHNIITEKAKVKKSKTEVNKYQCSTCMRSYNKKNSLILHIKTHGDSKKHVCFTCNREFNFEAHLNNHIINVHKHKKRFTCEYCRENFSSQSGLNVHKVSHNIKNKHKCNFCEKSFGIMSSLKEHVRTHTGEKPFLCSMCGKGFGIKNNLVQHIRRHQGLKPFKCSICTSSFVTKGELVSHSRSHTGLRPFVCSICGSAFTTSSSLVKHTRIHTKERPYHCTHCDKSFAASDTLVIHARTHTNERPYQCAYCDRAFTQRNDLISHIRCHTGEKPYVCHCGQSFRMKNTLKTHIKNFHKETNQLDIST